MTDVILSAGGVRPPDSPPLLILGTDEALGDVLGLDAADCTA